MDLVFYVFLQLTIISIAVKSATASASGTDPITFSSCLPFFGISPSNRTDDFPPRQCCDEVDAALEKGEAAYLCRFVEAGSPANATRVVSILDACSEGVSEFSLKHFCHAEALPPRESSANPSTEQPAAVSPNQASKKEPAADAIASPDQRSLPAEKPAAYFPNQTSSPKESSATHKISWMQQKIKWLQSGLLVFLVLLLSLLFVVYREYANQKNRLI